LPVYQEQKRATFTSVFSVLGFQLGELLAGARIDVAKRMGRFDFDFESIPSRPCPRIRARMSPFLLALSNREEICKFGDFPGKLRK
jgi:hypothetical protein